MAVDLATGVRVTVRQPLAPRAATTIPTTPRAVVVPVRGPAGPPGTDGSSDLTPHLTDPTPHPVYDDAPSLTLLFENGLI